MRLIAAVLAVGFLTVTPVAQDQTQGQPPVFRAGVDVVQLEVSVLDKQRRPVRGLTMADFAAFEDGDAQPIVDVQEFVLNDGAPEPVWGRAASADVATNSLSDHRIIAIVMDDLRCCYEPTPSLPDGRRLSDPWAIAHAKAIAGQLVDNLGPKDLATVALTREPRPLQPFTNDRDALRQVIARFAPMSEGGCMPGTSTSIRDLTRLLAMSPVPLKAVVHLMSIVPPGRISERNPRPTPCPPPSYRIPDTGRVVTGPMPRYDGPEPMAFELANVPVYTLNVSGLIVDTSKMASGKIGVPLGLMDGPNETGGQSYYRTNDLTPAVDDILGENDSYYLVGFRTSRPTLDGKYRRLEVKVTRPGDFDVRTRSGYRRPKPAPKPGSREEKNPRILRPPPSVSGLLPKTEITLDTTAGAFPRPGKGAVVIVNVDATHQADDTLTTRPQEIEVRAVVYRAGSPVQDVRAQARVDPVPGASRVRASVPLRFEITPDHYELWISARDMRTTRNGDVTQTLEVPDVAARAIGVSSVVLGSEPAEAGAIHPVLSGLVPIVPTNARVFVRGADITAYFQIYQGRTSPPGQAFLRMTILDEQGVTKFDRTDTLEPGRFSTTRTAEYKLRLPLETLGPGPHLLSVEARVGDRIAPAQSVPFQVR